MNQSNNSKPPRYHVKYYAVITWLLMTLSPCTSALADILPIPDSGIKKAIDDARVEIITHMEATTKLLRDLFIGPSTQVTTKDSAPNMALLGKGSATAATVTPYELVEEQSKKAAAQKIEASLELSQKADQTRLGTILLADKNEDRKATSEDLSAGSLTNTSADETKGEFAIALLSDFATPLGKFDPAEMKTKDGEDAKKYRATILMKAAIRSLILENLYDSFNARKSIAGLGEKSGMSAKEGASASLTAVEQYAASRRIGDEKWYATMNDAPPIVVEREMLFLLAEMRWQLYQMHRDNEKILRTLTALTVTSLHTTSLMADKNEVQLGQALDAEGNPKKPTADDTKGGATDSFKSPADKEKDKANQSGSGSTNPADKEKDKGKEK